jgi:ribonuclease D
MTLREMQLVDTQRALADVASAFTGASTFYIDTEFESRRDGTDLCLVQVSDGRSLFLIDALRLASFDVLRPVLGDSSSEWVVHAGGQDVPLLVERLKLDAPPRIFDTQVAWALVSPEYSVSLAYLRFRLLGVRTGKPHQADDWRRRPLPESQLAYAASDIEDLPQLHAALKARLEEKKRAEIVYPASLELARPTRAEAEPLSLDSFRNAWQLDRQGQAALRYIVEWYNALAPDVRATAPDVKTLLSIANRLPETREDLARIKGVPRRFANEEGNRFTGALMRATATADDASFVPIDPPPYATFEEIRIDGFLAQARAAISIQLEIAPELAFPSRILKRMRAAILEAGDDLKALDALDGWRAELLSRPLKSFVISFQGARALGTPS